MPDRSGVVLRGAPGKVSSKSGGLALAVRVECLSTSVAIEKVELASAGGELIAGEVAVDFTHLSLIPCWKDSNPRSRN